MPSYKHPCPYCGKFIDKIAAACPYCGHADPFAPKRCAACRKIVEPDWKACPSCGASLVAPPPAETDGTAAPAPAAAEAAAPPPTPAEPAEPVQPAEPELPKDGPKCTGCGAPLPAGARFCTTCGTMAG